MTEIHNLALFSSVIFIKNYILGYSGRNCEDTIHICDNNPCKNGALCLFEEGRSVCYCVPDFHGEHCEFQYDECQLEKR